jgi:uncharacterized protein YlxW (UPF0749 family)
MSDRVSKATVVIVCVLLGFLVMAQFQTHGLISKTRASASSADQSVILSNLVEANASLRAEIKTLEGQLNSYRTIGHSGLLETLVEELNRLKTVNGLVEVSGPGLQVRVSGQLSALNAQDLINELRNAGAEAIALNGERLVVWSAIAADDEGWLTVDGTRIASPYTFQAIGDGETLETALMRSGGLLAVLEHGYEGLEVQVRRHDKLVLPVHRYPPEFQHASFSE